MTELAKCGFNLHRVSSNVSYTAPSDTDKPGLSMPVVVAPAKDVLDFRRKT